MRPPRRPPSWLTSGLCCETTGTPLRATGGGATDPVTLGIEPLMTGPIPAVAGCVRPIRLAVLRSARSPAIADQPQARKRDRRLVALGCRQRCERAPGRVGPAGSVQRPGTGRNLVRHRAAEDRKGIQAVPDAGAGALQHRLGPDPPADDRRVALRLR